MRHHLLRAVFFVLATVAITSPVTAHAKAKYLDDVIKKATPEEKRDLGDLLEHIHLVPAKDMKTGKTLMRVARVDKGSVFDREGIKAGDLVAVGHDHRKGERYRARHRRLQSKSY